jgi:hypothetical protein
VLSSCLVCSYGELEWMGKGRADIVPLNLDKPLPKMSYKDGFQTRYFCLDSFMDGAAMLKEYSHRIQSERT